MKKLSSRISRIKQNSADHENTRGNEDKPEKKKKKFKRKASHRLSLTDEATVAEVEVGKPGQLPEFRRDSPWVVLFVPVFAAATSTLEQKVWTREIWRMLHAGEEKLIQNKRRDVDRSE